MPSPSRSDRRPGRAAIHALSSLAIVIALSAPLAALDGTGGRKATPQRQDRAAPDGNDPQTNDIVVTAPRRRGAVDTGLPAIADLGTEDIAAYGAVSLDDLLTLIAAETGSARGRGGGQPVVLLNGRRISGFRELRDLPPEAIERVQIFPEELALQYGYRPDQRVVNIILKPDFISGYADVEYGHSFEGGRGREEASANMTRIGPSGRLVTTIEYEHNAALTEAERDIRVEDGAFDETAFRTLLSQSDRMRGSASLARNIGQRSEVSVNASYQVEDQAGLVGVPRGDFFLPADSPFAVSDQDSIVALAFPGAGALRRDQTVGTAQAGASLTGQTAGGWRWSLASDYSHIVNRTTTQRRLRGPGLADLASAVEAGLADPFAPGFGADLRRAAPDFSRSLSQVMNNAATVSGTLAELPAGPLVVTARTGLNLQWLDSEARIVDRVTTARLHRRDANGAVNIDIPIADARSDVLPFLGRLSVNGNIGYSELSDFGGLIEYGAGINWSPLAEVTLIASLIGDESAPGITDLGNPVIITPDVSVYDFTRAQAARISVTTGGNPLLPAETKRDLRLALNWEADSITDGLRLEAEYLRNRSRGVTSGFPLLTPEIEAAFPERVTRDADGALVALDRRPVAFDRVESDRIRTSIRYRGRISDRRAASEGEARGRAGGGGPLAGIRGIPGMGGGGQGGGWNISLSHTYRLVETITIGPGVPVLDLLGGSATGARGGAARHGVEAEGGAYVSGFGLRLSASYVGPSEVEGDPLTGSSGLRFSDTANLNLRAFVDFDRRPGGIAAVPLLKASRLAIRIDNVLNDIQRVTDEDDQVPLAYQPGLIDPLGRTFELDFRKRF